MLRHLVLAALAASAAACIDSEPTFQVTELEVSGETDFGLLEVEVHLFDQDTRVHLGCAGEEEGLEDVDASDIRHLISAELIRPGTDDGLHESDLAGRRIEMIVIEDDDLPCPVPPGPDDDVIGIALDLGVGAFDTGAIFSFDRVVAMRAGFR